ncbi:MAG TPA: succinate dehydrogenase, cytochrome b556 subunit [Pseudomonadales bacterium]
MKTERPVYLSLTQFRWPLAAIASITHRITGVLLFAGTAYLIWLLTVALDSPAGFERAAGVLAAPFGKLVLLLVLAALSYHLFAGIKHLVMDFHYWDSVRAGRISSASVFALTAIVVILLGAWLW